MITPDGKYRFLDILWAIYAISMLSWIVACEYFVSYCVSSSVTCQMPGEGGGHRTNWLWFISIDVLHDPTIYRGWRRDDVPFLTVATCRSCIEVKAYRLSHPWFPVCYIISCCPGNTDTWSILFLKWTKNDEKRLLHEWNLIFTQY